MKKMMLGFAALLPAGVLFAQGTSEVKVQLALATNDPNVPATITPTSLLRGAPSERVTIARSMKSV